MNLAIVKRMKILHNSDMQQLFEQLKVTHAKISIFKLLQLSIDHIDALFEALKKIELDADIPIAKFVELVTNIDKNVVCNMICFQYSKFLGEDVIKKNLRLYICINVDGVLV